MQVNQNNNNKCLFTLDGVSNLDQIMLIDLLLKIPYSMYILNIDLIYLISCTVHMV